METSKGCKPCNKEETVKHVYPYFLRSTYSLSFKVFKFKDLIVADSVTDGKHRAKYQKGA